MITDVLHPAPRCIYDHNAKGNDQRYGQTFSISFSSQSLRMTVIVIVMHKQILLLLYFINILDFYHIII